MSINGFGNTSQYNPQVVAFNGVTFCCYLWCCVVLLQEERKERQIKNRFHPTTSLVLRTGCGLCCLFYVVVYFYRDLTIPSMAWLCCLFYVVYFYRDLTIPSMAWLCVLSNLCFTLL